MGLGKVNGVVKPSEAHYPTGTPEELAKMGEDLSVVHSCAIPQPDGTGSGFIVRGCMHAHKCSKFFGREKLGGFGPRSTAPGTPGQGPWYVGYHIETAEGEEKEDFTSCHAFMAGLYNRAKASVVPDAEGNVSNERIRILGVQGKAKIVVYEALPQEPKLCNKNGNNTIITETKVITIPEYPRPHTLDPRWRERRARREAEQDDFADDMMGTSAASGMDDLTEAEADAFALETAAAEGDGLSQPIVTSEPMKRRGK